MSNILRNKISKEFGTMVNLAKKINIPASTVKAICERGATNSNALNVKKICDALNIDMYALLEGQIKDYVPNTFKLTLKERKFIEDYRTLDDYGVEALDNLLYTETERNKFYANRIEYLWKPMSDTQASAGTGSELLDYSEFVKIPRTDEAEMCDFVVKIQGDSMSPLYENGDCVLVKSTPDLTVGETGLFILNNEGFIKTMGVNSLISQNPRYEPIYPQENDICLVVGKVLGKTEVIE